MKINSITVTIRPAAVIQQTMDLIVQVKVAGMEITDRKLVPEFDLVSKLEQYMQIITEEIRDHFLNGDDDETRPAGTQPPTTPSV